MKDVFAVQEEIARSIASELRVALGTTSKLAIRGTTDIEAHDLYLKGRFYWNQRDRYGVERSIEYFNAALKRDSTYALAWVGLADAHALSGSYLGRRPSDADRDAETAACRALSIDSTIAEAYATLGLIYHNKLRWRESDDYFKRAIALRPDYATAHHWYTLLLRAVGDMDSAQAEIRTAAVLDPTSAAIATNVGINLFVMRQYDRAIEVTREVLTRSPGFWNPHQQLGFALAMKGEYAAAEEALKKADALSGISNGAELGWVYGLSGQKAKADSVLRHLRELERTRYVNPLDVALVYVGTGDKESALRHLEQAVSDGEGTELAWMPQLDPLRSDPRFGALLRKIGLPPS